MKNVLNCTEAKIRDNAGLKGGSGENAESIEVSSIIDHDNPSETINIFKSFLVEHLHSNPLKNLLEDHLQSLYKNEDIENYYNVVALVDEFNKLENLYFKFRKEISFLPFLRSFLTRVDKKISEINEKEESDNTKILKYLRISISRKICGIVDETKNFVINFPNYLNTTREYIKQVKNAIRTELVVNLSESYKQKIDLKIIAAREIIDTDIRKKIDKILIEVKNNIDNLIKNVDSS